MFLKKSQSGRSMVEMLGVLAIIGVLSIGGIAGYSMSMRKHRANQIVDLLSKYALSVYIDCQKRIIEGDSVVQDQFTCSFDNHEFKNMGIGTLPSGIEFGSTITYLANKNNPSDTVYINIDFSSENQQICKAAATIVGRKCLDNNQGGYYISVAIKQN